MIDIINEFSQDPSICYLNHAAMGPWPERTSRAVTKFAEENTRVGSKHYDRWLSVERQLRQGLATLINAGSIDDIGLVKNTSEGLSVIAYGLDWSAGDEILILDQEFPSNRIVWESLKSQGVVIKIISCNDGETPELALCRSSSPQTRLISVSSVQYASSARVGLDKLSQYCQQNNILLCVDAIQSAGALPIDIQSTPVDFLVADGHKWLLGPEGIALFYCAEKQRERLAIKQYGWHMVEALGDYDRTDWQIAKSARRFECGSPNMLGIHALNASVSLLLEAGMENVSSQVLGHTRYLISSLQSIPGMNILSEIREAHHGGIVTFAHPNIDSAQMYASLKKQEIMCANRGGGVRFSPHFYNSKPQLDYALEKVESLIQAA